MRAAAMTSSPSTPPQSSKPLFDVSTVDAFSCRALMSWKEHGAVLVDRQVADLVDHQQSRMTVHDGHRLPDALDDLAERSLTPTVMLGDSHYGSADNMALTHYRNIDLVAPARPPKGAASGRLTLEDFILDEEGLVLRCPNNVEPVSTSLAQAKLQARFDLTICRSLFG